MRVSKYMGQVKTINGICFKVMNYYKGTLTILADQYDGSLQLCVSSWKKYEDGSETTKRSSLHPVNKRFQSSFTTLSKETAIEDDLGKFKKYIDELCEEASDEGEEYYKHFYRKLAKQYHPDVCHHPNATELFKIVKRCWESITFGD